ncbi:MAG: DEAD/DEAH box helicase [Patescibacteria group bacterium]
MTTPLEPGFYGLGIAPRLLEILWKLKFKTPTPIQAQAIPVAIEGKDLIGVAQTGTGKTLAFGIPLIQRLSQFKGRGLVVLPTRELALQAEEVFRTIGRQINLRTAVLIGGASMKMQLDMLRRNPHVIIATPGRLNDHLEQKTVNLRDVHILVLDEADRMLDMGFAPQIKRIMQHLPAERQTMLFSATMPAEIVGLASKFMKLPVQIEIARSGTAAENVTQELYVVNKEDKAKLLDQILVQRRGSVLVFTRTKHGAKKVARSLRMSGISSAEIHSNRSLSQRREALDGFKSGKYRVLVATDIAARGLDVKDIELVVNYDLPEQAEDYVHRIGRTGRAGASGYAISIATPDQRKEVEAIERLTRSRLPISKLTGVPEPRSGAYSEPRTTHPGAGHRRSFRRRRP